MPFFFYFYNPGRHGSETMMRLAPLLMFLPLADACGQVAVPVDDVSCLGFDLSTLPSGPFQVIDTSPYHTPYVLSSPCHNAPTNECANTVAASPAYALVGASPNTRCYSLGGAAGAGGVLPLGTETTALLCTLEWRVKLRISVQGGEGGRTLIYNLVCNATAPRSQGPEATAAHSALTYPFTWHHPAGCGTHLTGTQCPAPPKQPVPTKAQLAYQNAEIVAIVCFQMDTYAANDGDPGCNAANWAKGINTSSPATYNPTKLNVSQWVAVSESMGAKYAWLTAKHGCGFLLWPTKTKLPDGRPYGYDVSAPGAGSHVDVVKEWMQQLRSAGIGPGLYYSIKDNFYLNAAKGGLVKPGTLLPGQERISQADFEALELAQLTELWGNYGELAETWFDGGEAGRPTCPPPFRN